MLDVFSKAFSSTFLAVLQVFLVIFAAGLLVRRKLLTQAHIAGLSTATVLVFLPCLIFSNVIRNLNPGALPFWWAIPLSAIGMSLLGLALGYLAFLREMPAKRNMLPLASMQNAGYLVLPIGLTLFPDRFDTFALYCFLFILGFNPVLWSVGNFLTTTGGHTRPNWKSLLTPPLAANVLAILAVMTGGKSLIPDTVLRAVNLLGTAAVPVATFILGAVLGGITLRFRSHLFDALRTIVIKLVLLPAVVMTIVYLSGMNAAYPLLARFFIIQSAAAPAAGIILQVKSYGGDEQKIGSVMFLSYLVCIFTMPLWVAAWNLLSAS